MPSAPTLAAFSVAVLLLVLLPGPAMLFLVARGVAGGPRAGVVSALGVECATALYLVASALGLTAVLATSAVALSVVRYAGAAYLVVLGVRTIAARHQPLAPAAPHTAARAAGGGGWRAWREGFVVGVTNPKVALFFLAFFPQFLHPGAGPVWSQVAVLGAIFLAIATVLDCGYGMAGGALARLVSGRSAGLRRGRVAAGSAYLALAGWTAAGGRG